MKKLQVLAVLKENKLFQTSSVNKDVILNFLLFLSLSLLILVLQQYGIIIKSSSPEVFWKDQTKKYVRNQEKLSRSWS